MIQQMTRQAMRELKDKTDEEMRIEKVNHFTKIVYDDAIRQAIRSYNAIYRFDINNYINTLAYNYVKDNREFINKNEGEIIRTLQRYFPDCTVEYKKLVKDADGIVRDISEIDLNMRPFIINSINNPIQEYIIIDWS